ncbi:hypothetical protein Nepgr_031007 [Nepenthes gracilis]|uniref:Uncharacterized protein n=1 Tax=Nepenthes gracilis TaxID=150966 RepID=A0AAD3THH2_NEPGR|nr:hypothetical protein Nepgr_031007 [Nepenthes gracilis]
MLGSALKSTWKLCYLNQWTLWWMFTRFPEQRLFPPLWQSSPGNLLDVQVVTPLDNRCPVRPKHVYEPSGKILSNSSDQLPRPPRKKPSQALVALTPRSSSGAYW